MRLLLVFAFLCSSILTLAQSKKKLKQAREWEYQEDLKLRYKNADASAALCAYYHEGKFDGKIYPELIHRPTDWYAKMGSRQGCLYCTYWYGWWLVHPVMPQYVQPDYANAIVFLTKAADAGNTDAIKELINIYENATYYSNQTLAKQWITKSAANGDSLSKEKLKGFAIAADDPIPKGVEAYAAKDFTKAGAYWKAALDYSRDPNAAFNLGILELNGEGRPKNLVAAEVLFAKAGELGKAEGYYWAGKINADQGNNETTLYYWDKAIKGGYPGLEEAVAKIRPGVEAVRAANKARWAQEDAAREQQRLQQNASAAEQQRRFEEKEGQGKQTFTKTIVPANKKTCPICNGTGKKTGSYTSERRDPKTNEVILTGHTTTSSCSRCNGKGYID